MIFGKRNGAFRQRFQRSWAIEPSRRDESAHRPADHILEQIATLIDAAARLLPREAEKFSLAGGHEAGAKPVRRLGVPRLVAMIKAVKEHLDVSFCPGPQPCRERRPGDNRRF